MFRIGDLVEVRSDCLSSVAHVSLWMSLIVKLRVATFVSTCKFVGSFLARKVKGRSMFHRIKDFL